FVLYLPIERGRGPESSTDEKNRFADYCAAGFRTCILEHYQIFSSLFEPSAKELDTTIKKSSRPKRASVFAKLAPTSSVEADIVVGLQLIPAVGVIAFAAWGLRPLLRACRILFKQLVPEDEMEAAQGGQNAVVDRRAKKSQKLLELNERKDRHGRSTRAAALSSPVVDTGDDDDGEEEREALDLMEMLKKEEEMLSAIKEKQKQGYIAKLLSDHGSYEAFRGWSLVVQLIPAVGVIAFAAWGLGPLLRACRILFLQKKDNSWTRVNDNQVMTSYIQPLLLWGGVVFISRHSYSQFTELVILPSAPSQVVKQRLLNFVRSLSTSLAFGYCLSSAIPSAVFYQPPIGQVGLGEQQVTGTVVPAITMIF
ncbi:hypothetical protein Tco_0844445, partial [Tanacetum coccineum]